MVLIEAFYLHGIAVLCRSSGSFVIYLCCCQWSKKAHFSDVVSSVMAALTVSKQQLGTKRSMKVGRERVTAIEIDTEIQRNKERDRWGERGKRRET